jgi:hypothetical protein
MKKVEKRLSIRDIRPKGLEFELAGQKHSLRFTLGALAELEDKTGKSFDQYLIEAASVDVGSVRIRAIGSLLWAGLLHEDPELTLDDVLNTLTLADIADAFQPLYEALMEHMPDQPDASEGDEGNAPAGQTA